MSDYKYIVLHIPTGHFRIIYLRNKRLTRVTRDMLEEACVSMIDSGDFTETCMIELEHDECANCPWDCCKTNSNLKTEYLLMENTDDTRVQKVDSREC